MKTLDMCVFLTDFIFIVRDQGSYFVIVSCSGFLFKVSFEHFSSMVLFLGFYIFLSSDFFLELFIFLTFTSELLVEMIDLILMFFIELCYSFIELYLIETGFQLRCLADGFVDTFGCLLELLLFLVDFFEEFVDLVVVVFETDHTGNLNLYLLITIT